MPDAMAAADAGPGGLGEARALLLPWLLGGLGLAAAAALLALVLPAPTGEPRPVFCPSRLLLGLPCPGCGMTRAVAALLRGDLAGAFILHPWAPVLAAQLALGWAAWGWSLSGTPSGRLLRPARWLGPALLANLAALAALWLGRLAIGSLP